MYLVAPSAALGDGTYQFRVRAVDVAGNASALSPLSLSIRILNSTPTPAPTLALAHVDDTGSSDTDNITNIAQPRFTGTCRWSIRPIRAGSSSS